MKVLFPGGGWKLITVCFFLSVMIILITMGVAIGVPVKYIGECEELNDIIVLYPDDTVLAANLTDCQVSPSLTPMSPPLSHTVHLYVTNCSNVKTYTEYLPQIIFPESPNVSIGFTFIPSVLSDTNYYARGTTVEVTTKFEVTTQSDADVFLCLFNNSDDFDKFIPSPKSKEGKESFQHIIQQSNCHVLDINATTTTHFSIDTSGYYYGGISSLGTIDLVQVNMSLVRRFYNHSDFNADLVVDCSLSRTCSIEKTSSRTCILLRALPDFDYDPNKMIVQAELFLESSKLPITLSVVIGLLIIISIFVGVCIVHIRGRIRHKRLFALQRFYN